MDDSKYKILFISTAHRSMTPGSFLVPSWYLKSLSSRFHFLILRVSTPSYIYLPMTNLPLDSKCRNPTDNSLDRVRSNQKRPRKRSTHLRGSSVLEFISTRAVLRLVSFLWAVILMDKSTGFLDLFGSSCRLESICYNYSTKGLLVRLELIFEKLEF